MFKTFQMIQVSCCYNLVIPPGILQQCQTVKRKTSRISVVEFLASYFVGRVLVLVGVCFLVFFLPMNGQAARFTNPSDNTFFG